MEHNGNKFKVSFLGFSKINFLRAQKGDTARKQSEKDLNVLVDLKFSMIQQLQKSVHTKKVNMSLNQKSVSVQYLKDCDHFSKSPS